jgi:hypothetical protein
VWRKSLHLKGFRITRQSALLPKHVAYTYLTLSILELLTTALNRLKKLLEGCDLRGTCVERLVDEATSLLKDSRNLSEFDAVFKEGVRKAERSEEG